MYIGCANHPCPKLKSRSDASMSTGLNGSSGSDHPTLRVMPIDPEINHVHDKVEVHNPFDLFKLYGIFLTGRLYDCLSQFQI